MVHDFSETILCDAINFKHKTFILNSLSNAFLKGNLPNRAQQQLKGAAETRIGCISSKLW